MNTTTKRQGYRSPKNGHLGVYTLCSGPDPNGPAPGERLIIVIYDGDDNIVRRLEQVKGNCIDPGYVDFFLSAKCRPSVHDYHIIDIDRDGNKTILATHTTPTQAVQWLTANVPLWVKEHGVQQS
jgi:hypothetical protein